MPDETNSKVGQLVMTGLSGEQSSFSTPFIKEFNSQNLRYYQYFELVIINNFEDLNSDSNYIDFDVLIKDTDYTTIGNEFTKGLDLHFTNSGIECKYVRESSLESDIISDSEIIKNILKNNVSVISFIIYPKTLEDNNFKSLFFDNENCHELSIFINGIKISKEDSNYGFKIPDSLVSNYSIGIDFANNSGNFLYQWNLDNTRFIYTDLAYQCYEEIEQKEISKLKYLPIENINIINNYTNYNLSKNNYLILPYIVSNNEDNNFRMEYVVPNLDNLNFIVILGTFKDHEYIINKENIDENNIKDILEEGFIIVSNSEKDSFLYLDKEGNLNEIDTNTNIEDLGFRIIDYYINEGKIYSIYENKELLDDHEFDEKEYNSSDIQIDDFSFLKNILVLSNELNYYPNLGTTTYYNIFKGLENIRTIYNSSQNMLWKSMFYKYSIYPFSSPLLNNPIFLPYSLNLFSDRLSETMNMYIEFTFDNINKITYYLYMGCQYSTTISDNQDIEKLKIDNGLIVKFKESSYSLYTYKNGEETVIIDNKNIDSTTVFFKYLCTDDHFTIGIGNDRNEIDDRDIFNNIYSIAIHAIPDDDSITEFGNITINFGPDNIVYQEELEDLTKFDQYDKEFTIDIDSDFEYAKNITDDDEDKDNYTITGEIEIDSEEIDADDGYSIDGNVNINKEYITDEELNDHYTITGDTNIDKTIVDIDDNNYIIIGDTNIDKEELTEEELNDHYTIEGTMDYIPNITYNKENIVKNNQFIIKIPDSNEINISYNQNTTKSLNYNDIKNKDSIEFSRDFIFNNEFGIIRLIPNINSFLNINENYPISVSNNNQYNENTLTISKNINTEDNTFILNNFLLTLNEIIPFRFTFNIEAIFTDIYNKIYKYSDSITIFFGDGRVYKISIVNENYLNCKINEYIDFSYDSYLYISYNLIDGLTTKRIYTKNSSKYIIDRTNKKLIGNIDFETNNSYGDNIELTNLSYFIDYDKSTNEYICLTITGKINITNHEINDEINCIIFNKITITDNIGNKFSMYNLSIPILCI